jgi:putative ABC transport system permease protein
MDELRFAARRLATRPGPTVVSILTLACAIGAAAATVSLLMAVVLRPLPVSDPARLVVVGHVSPMGSGTRVSDSHSYPGYERIRERGVFGRIAAGGALPPMLPVASGGSGAQTPVYFASHGFFDVLGVPLEIGRAFSTDDDRRGAPLVAVLSEQYWRRTFNSDPDVLGRTITIQGQPATIVGVARRGFRGLSLARAPDVYLPLHSVGELGFPFVNYFADKAHSSSSTSWITVIGRIPANSSPAQALARLSTPDERRPGARPFVLTDINTTALPASGRGGIRQFTRLLGATVSLLLLIGCSTVGMLLLVRTEARQPEFATCLALGASRLRLARGVALEGALLALAGAALAIPVAHWLFTGVRAFQLPGGIALERLDLRIDPVVLLAAAGFAAGATLLVALIAGVFGFRADISDGLRARAGATPRMTRRLTRSFLVTAQVAVALVLLTGAGLFGRSLFAALRLNPGIEASRILQGSLALADGSQARRLPDFYDALRARLDGSPFVHSMATYVTAGGMGARGTLLIEGTPREMPTYVPFMGIDNHYVPTMGMQLLEGRHFTTADSDHAPAVAIVSASFARLIADGRSAIGRRITMPFSRKGEPSPVVEVTGVVPDVITQVATLEPLVLYTPMLQHSFDPGRDISSRTIVLRAADDVEAARRAFAEAVTLLDSNLRPPPMLTIDQRLALQMMPQRFGGLVLGALGFIAILLTVLGTYVMAESMAVLRMREMGIRAALGATSRQLGQIVLVETVRLVGLGVAAGLLLAWMGASTIRALLFHVEPLDPATLIAVASGILVLSLAVSVRPAIRAARVDLGSVLRAE